MRITNIRNRLQNLYKKITDYTYNNIERVNTKVEEVNALKNQCKKLKNLDFVAKTDEFRRRLRNG